MRKELNQVKTLQGDASTSLILLKSTMISRNALACLAPPNVSHIYFAGLDTLNPIESPLAGAVRILVQGLREF